MTEKDKIVLECLSIIESEMDELGKHANSQENDEQARRYFTSQWNMLGHVSWKIRGLLSNSMLNLPKMVDSGK